MKLPSRANIITGTLLTASLVMIVGVVYFAFSIQVITNWRLTPPTGDIHAGDTIIVASRYTKLRQVTGTSRRTLECQTQPGIYLSTPLNRVDANRAPGTTGTGVLVTIPKAIKGIASLPDPCHVCIALAYPVLPFRTVPYFKCTKDFMLLPAVVSESPAASQTTPSQVAVISPAQVRSFVISSSNDIPISTPQQQDGLQSAQPAPAEPSDPQPVNPQPQPSGLQQILNGATGVVQGVGGFLAGLL